MRRTLALFLLLTLVPFAAARSQGLAWESTVTLPMGDAKEGHVTTLYMPKMIKQLLPERGRATIIRLDKELFITVNEKEKTFSEITFAEMSARLKELGGVKNDKLAEMQQKLKELPEDQRKVVEKMMGGMTAAAGDDAPLELKHDAGTETIGGYACTKSVFRRGESDVLTLWTTKDVKGFDAMAADLHELGSRLASMLPANGKALADAYRRAEGFPMKIAGQGFSTTVTKVEARTTPAEEFAPPPGFKKVDADMGRMPRAGGGGKHD